MWETVCGSGVLSFIRQSQKSHRCIRREFKAKATRYSQDVFPRWSVLGGLRPLILPAAHLPSGNLGFWVWVGNTVSKQLPSCLSRYETSNRWSCSNHVANAPLLPSLFSCHLSQLPCHGANVKLTSVCLHFWLSGMQILRFHLSCLIHSSC